MNNCEDCPFSTACPLKRHVKSPCIIGRNPLRAYMSVWVTMVVASAFLF